MSHVSKSFIGNCGRNEDIHYKTELDIKLQTHCFAIGCRNNFQSVEADCN